MLDVVSTLNIIPHFTGHVFLFARSGFWCSHEHFCFTNCFSFGLFNQWWVPHNSCERVKTACWWHIFLSLIWQMHLTLWSQFGGRYQQSCLSKTFICIYFLNVQYVHVSMCSLVHNLQLWFGTSYMYGSTIIFIKCFCLQLTSSGARGF